MQSQRCCRHQWAGGGADASGPAGHFMTSPLDCTAGQLSQLPCMQSCCSHETHHHTAAGINGLEVGQTLVIAMAIACHNLIELGGVGGSNPATRDGHLFSLILMAPLAGCTYGLAAFNWFPAQVC